MDKILVTTVGMGLIGFIWWFFFGKKEKAIVAGDVLEILVDGGYKPALIRLKKGKKTTLKITRRDPNSCLEEIILPDFKIKKFLSLNKEVEISIIPQKTGEFGFHCGMNMYHGKIIVE
ncbi:MAG: Cupredoxin family domain protein [Candidatus Woesebacteria bacterium GW2011_GWB1_39_12]|uniref:Cupredoxin family domain protein n=2 Tax=Candidatus Woeseibacteriota TaxID=1752722 RepID=A0A0G0MD51_9BACT|nr:MAG: Cupredoxin family domain protein [Candidatus Woesebacteria bacterium GW2011_GWA1_39_12]KKR01059.1 MAG: Cupredoxin family domain protein [Candidatus Woesebacteria bacterium GW2011_GWB1_39_12]